MVRIVLGVVRIVLGVVRVVLVVIGVEMGCYCRMNQLVTDYVTYIDLSNKSN